jgi:hypothetical protein
MGIPIQSAHVPLLAEIGVTPIRRANRRPESSRLLTPGSPSAHPTPALVARAQGGLTLGPEGGELDPDF